MEKSAPIVQSPRSYDSETFCESEDWPMPLKKPLPIDQAGQRSALKSPENRSFSFFMLKVMLAVKAVLGDGESRSLSANYRLVDDLGFDSLKMANLSIALEDRLGETILLNDWIARSPSPDKLTIESLAYYIYHRLS